MGKDALYLKYRPFNLDDLVGQRHVVATLKQASVQDKFAHSYLLSGNKGSGKTTTARILANLLTCDDVKNGKLCGKCPACMKIHNGTAMDVVEMDGAKNRSVDDVEKLIDSARFSPQEFKRKIYIIDECHQLSSTAISALLKIVEEPPEYLTFIFCTTELHKIPDTILSRSQRFNFLKIMSKDVVTRLKFIAESEKININDPALFDIARLGRGSMRDAIGYLEQIATAAAGKQIKSQFKSILGHLIDREFTILSSPWWIKIMLLLLINVMI